METKLHLCVVTQDSTVFDETVSYVNLPTVSGSVGILTGHAPMVCAIARGRIRCGMGEDSGAVIEVGGGIAEVSENVVTVLTSDARVAE